MSESIEQIRVYNLPVSDLSNINFSIEITDTVASDTGQDIVSFMRNRDLSSAWITTESDDSADTQILCDISDSSTVTDIFLIGHNFKDFKIEYWTGTVWELIENVTNNEDDFYHNEVIPELTVTKIRFTVYSTIIADQDKKITRLIIAEKLEAGQFSSWPKIKKATQNTVQKRSKMLSGRSYISNTTPSFSVSLDWAGVTTQEDVDIIERMFLGGRPFMIWINGGSDIQFRFKLTGYRKQDFYIVKPTKDYIADYYKGYYSAMLKQGIDLVEVVV